MVIVSSYRAMMMGLLSFCSYHYLKSNEDIEDDRTIGEREKDTVRQFLFANVLCDI